MNMLDFEDVMATVTALDDDRAREVQRDPRQEFGSDLTDFQVSRIRKYLEERIRQHDEEAANEEHFSME